MAGRHLCQSKQPLKSTLPFAFGAPHSRLARPEEIARAGMRSCIQRFNNDFWPNAIDRHSSLLRVEQQLAVLKPVHVKLDRVTNPQTRIAQQENKCANTLGIANTSA